nr:uncharacterized protein LOC105485375 [Macaca nemestrina]
MPHNTIPKQSALGRLERAGIQDWPGLSALNGDGEDDRLEVLRPRNASGSGVRSAGSTGWAVGGVLGQLLLKGLGDHLQRYSPFNFQLQTFVPCYVHSITLAVVGQTKTLSPSLTAGRVNNRSKHGEKIQSGSHGRAGLGGARARDPFPPQMRAAGAAPPAAPDDPSQLGGCFEPVTRDWLTRSSRRSPHRLVPAGTELNGTPPGSDQPRLRSDAREPQTPQAGLPGALPVSSPRKPPLRRRRQPPPPHLPGKPATSWGGTRGEAEPGEGARVAAASAALGRLESQPQFPPPPGLLHSELFLIPATTPFRGAISSDQSLPHIHSQFVSPVRVKRLQNPTASHTSTWGQASCYLCGDDCNGITVASYHLAPAWALSATPQPRGCCGSLPAPPYPARSSKGSALIAKASGRQWPRLLHAMGPPHLPSLSPFPGDSKHGEKIQSGSASAILTITHQARTHDDGLLSWLLPPSVGRVFSGSAGCVVFTARPLLIASSLFLFFPGHLTSYGCVCLLTAL